MRLQSRCPKFHKKSQCSKILRYRRNPASRLLEATLIYERGIYYNKIKQRTQYLYLVPRWISDDITPFVQFQSRPLPSAANKQCNMKSFLPRYHNAMTLPAVDTSRPSVSPPIIYSYKTCPEQRRVRKSVVENEGQRG